MLETVCVLVEDYLGQVLSHMDFDFSHGWEDICFKGGNLRLLPPGAELNRIEVGIVHDKA